MSTSRTPWSKPIPLVALLFAALACSASWADYQGGTPEARARYARESAACGRIADHDTRANCLSEASTRYRSTLPLVPEESPEVLRQNALRRCEPLPDDQRRDCVARIQGHGTVSGSVESGAIYRELVTREIVLPAAPTGAGPTALPPSATPTVPPPSTPPLPPPPPAPPR
jgi:hypothetical protein